jgi:hypothetical protein
MVDRPVSHDFEILGVMLDGAFALALSKVYAMLTPSIGFCAMP